MIQLGSRASVSADRQGEFPSLRTDERHLMRWGRTALYWVSENLIKERASRLDSCFKRIRNPMGVLSTAFVAALLCGNYLHPRALILAAGLGGVLVVGTAFPYLSLLGLSGMLFFRKERVREGEEVEVHLAIRNRLPWSAWGLGIRGVHADADEVADTVGMPVSPGWRVTEMRWAFAPSRRGVYPLNSVHVTSGFPFGLYNASRPLSVPSKLIVWPRTFRVGPIPEADSGCEGAGVAPSNKLGLSGELLGVRPYRRGDSLRRIHWPQSARHGHIIICELESMAIPKVQVVLDTSLNSHMGSGSNGSFEWAIRIAASFAEDWTSQGAEVQLVHGANASLASNRATGLRGLCLLDALARLEPDQELTLKEVLSLPNCLDFEGALRVVVTTDIGVRTLDATCMRERYERFVVLESLAFAGGGARQARMQLPIRPWIWIDDPSNVPGLMQRRGKEAALVH